MCTAAALAKHIAQDWLQHPVVERRVVTFVNFGALNYPVEPMPGRSSIRMQNKFEVMLCRSIDAQARSIGRHFHNKDQSGWYKEIKHIGIRSRCEADRSREQVLDENIVAGWQEADVEF